MALVTVTFNPGTHTWVVPAGVKTITAELWGAQGSPTGTTYNGGKGGYLKTELPVTAGETLQVNAGALGAGGNGASHTSGMGTASGYNGGGASDIRRGGTNLTDRVAVAGGGGGHGESSSSASGGAGGGLTGGNGVGSWRGYGGTQSAGGAGGSGGGQAGSLGEGGSGAYAGSGGGDGYYGGGGGGGYYDGTFAGGGAGGGGSSYSSGTILTNSQGVREGAGLVQITYDENEPPNAPTLVSPADASTIDLGITQRFTLEASDPNPTDSTSKTYWRYRVVGATSWTEVTKASPSTFYDFPPGTFTAGNYEWQAATEDAQGEKGPYSTSSFFTADVPTDVPTITSPVGGGTVAADPTTVEWSTAGGQDAYQVRRVADNAGAPDTATVYYDSGQVNSTTVRAASVPFETNDRYEHIQVRVFLDGLWSSWATIRVLVSYTPPPVPTVALEADPVTGSLLVSITNPDPAAGEPAVVYNDVYVDDGSGEVRKVTQLPVNTSWRYMLPVSGRDYASSVRVVAVGENETTSSSI